MNKYSENSIAITTAIGNYFNGVYNGDIELLRSVFHPQALVVGDVNDVPYFKTFSEYLDVVKKRKSPSDLGESFRMEILSMEIINSIAVVKARLGMFEFNYTDLLSLNIINGRWLIVNKLMTNVK
jgi:hypothetical protein